MFAIPDNLPPRLQFRELASSEDRFRVLCDIIDEDKYLLPITRKQHRLDGLGLIVVKDCVSTRTACYIFETLCPTSDESPLSGSKLDTPVYR